MLTMLMRSQPRYMKEVVTCVTEVQQQVQPGRLQPQLHEWQAKDQEQEEHQESKSPTKMIHFALEGEEGA
jgi:hypothetical protein